MNTPFFWPPKPVRVWRETSTFDRLSERFKNGEFSCEPKIDGWRTLVYVDGTVRAMSRHGKVIVLNRNVTSKLATLPSDTLLDGELLGPRGGETRFVAFDVIKLNGMFVMDQPYRERREILEGCLNVDYVLTLTGELSELYDRSLSEGNEGLVLKKVSSPWKAMSKEGEEFDAWLKIKRRPRLENGKVLQ